MPTYTDIETAIKTRLEADISSSDAEIVEMNEADDLEKPFDKPRITIMYLMSEYSDEIIRGYPNNFASDVAAQDEYFNIRLVIQSRYLRTNSNIKSVHWLLNQSKLSLLGYRIQGWGRLFLRKTQFADHENGIFTYEQIFVGKRQVIQQFTDDHGTEGADLTQTDFEQVIT